MKIVEKLLELIGQFKEFFSFLFGRYIGKKEERLKKKVEDAQRKVAEEGLKHHVKGLVDERIRKLRELLKKRKPKE